MIDLIMESLSFWDWLGLAAIMVTYIIAIRILMK